jgi:hypothetical protein
MNDEIKKGYGEILKKKPDKNDPFEGMGMGALFGLPLARYAYDVVDKEQKDLKKKKKE